MARTRYSMKMGSSWPGWMRNCMDSVPHSLTRMEIFLAMESVLSNFLISFILYLRRREPLQMDSERQTC